METNFGFVSGSITASVNGTAQVDATILNNRVDGPIGGGSETESALNMTVIGNSITLHADTFSLGLAFYAYGSSVTTAAAMGNRIESASTDGVILLDDGFGTVNVTEFDQNIISDIAQHGIHTILSNPASTVTGTKNNVVKDVGGNSLEVEAESVPGSIMLNGVTISPLVDTP